MSFRVLRSVLLVALAAGLAPAQGQPAATPNDIMMFLDRASPATGDGADTRDVKWVDFDGDGDLDLFLVNFGMANILFRNNGEGRFEHVPEFALTADRDYSYGAAWGDFDGDGDADLAVANGNDQHNALYRNAAVEGTEGRFHRLTEDPAVSDAGESYDVEMADFDGDGWLDLVFANRLQENFLYRNLGAGVFDRWSGTPVTEDPGTSRDVDVGDIDGDGDPDIVFANSNAQANAIYFNEVGESEEAGEQFRRLTDDPAATMTGDTYGVSLGDFDNDGDLDLFASNRRDEFNALYRNQGDGTFVHEAGHAPSQGAGDSYRSAWADLDEDGDLDLYVTNRDQDNFFYLNVLENDEFVLVDDTELTSLGGDSRGVAIADLDGDAWQEVVVANTLGEDNFLFRNRGMQWVGLGASKPAEDGPWLTASGDLHARTTLTLSVGGGAPHAVGILVIGGSVLGAPFQGGLIVPMPDFVLQGFVLDDEGALSFDATVPPGLPEAAQLVFQMWMRDHEGWRATNAISATTPWTTLW